MDSPLRSKMKSYEAVGTTFLSEQSRERTRDPWSFFRWAPATATGTLLFSVMCAHRTSGWGADNACPTLPLHLPAPPHPSAHLEATALVIAVSWQLDAANLAATPMRLLSARLQVCESVPYRCR